jgi:hypothetical protein
MSEPLAGTQQPATTTVPTAEQPRYAKVRENPGAFTPLFIITCDEGWRQSIVCEGMYEWAADWLVSIVQGKPYAPGTRP